jgi:hypothetical protein
MEENTDCFDVKALPVSNTVIKKLESVGFKFLKDFDDISVTELAKGFEFVILNPQESSITFKEASEVMDYIKGNTKTLGAATHRAIDLLIKSNKPSITTYCPNMNEMLGGGVQSGCLTEFCLIFKILIFKRWSTR